VALNRQDIAATVHRVIAPLARRVRLMIARGIVELVTDTTKAQTVQVSLLADEVHSDVERWESYGMTSVPVSGAEALFLSLAGDRSHGAIVCVMDRRTRPAGQLAEGDVGLWTASYGLRIRLVDADGSLELAGATDYVALAEKSDQAVADIKAWVDGIVAAITASVPAPTDGGAALKASILAHPQWPAVTTAPESTAAEKVRAE
jgi:phage baseplate assembly protein V